MIFDSAFVVAGNNNNVGNAGSRQFFDDMLDNRLVDQRQHFFGHGLCLGQKTRAETGGGNDRLGNFGLAHDKDCTTRRLSWPVKFYSLSCFFISRWASCGLALPLDCFITCPTRKPMAFISPFLTSSAA